jgi:hypothetical protein
MASLTLICWNIKQMNNAKALASGGRIGRILSCLLYEVAVTSPSSSRPARTRKRSWEMLSNT